MTTSSSSSSSGVCRILVIGSPKGRVTKVSSILRTQVSEYGQCNKSGNDDGNVISTTNHATIQIKYIPCVVKFGSYRHDDTNEIIRYLLRVDYFGIDCTDTKPSSLLQFFDSDTAPSETESSITVDGPLFPSPPVISGAIIIGIDSPNEKDEIKDVEMVRTFVRTISSNATIPIECIQPTPPYQSMYEEFNFLKQLSINERDQQTTIGPTKMANVAYTFAQTIISQRIEEQAKLRRQQQQEHEQEMVPQLQELNITDVTNDETVKDTPKIIPTPMVPNFDGTKTRYSCKKCRCVVFDENDLEDPPHVPLTHKFSYRKQRHAGLGGSMMNQTPEDPCQSYFVQEGSYVITMNLTNTDSDDTYATEGKLICPKCKTKLGTYNWSGGQCSCGTWTVPAIQIPKSKVDIIVPMNNSSNGSDVDALPPGAILSPIVRLMQVQQQQQQQYQQHLQQHQQAQEPSGVTSNLNVI